MPIIMEKCADGLRTDVFSALVQVRINICRGSDVGMSEILRHIEQRDVFVDEDAGEGMPQVMEADMPHSVFFKDLREAEGDIPRGQQVAELVRADIIVVFPIVTVPEHPAVEFLLRLLFEQHFVYRIGDRQAAAAAGILHFFDRAEELLSVHFNLHNLGIQQDLTLFHTSA